MKRIFALPFLLLTSVAGAQPGLEEPPAPPPPPAQPSFVEHVYVNVGVLVTVDHFLNAAWLVDTGVRLADLPFSVHASGATGGSLDADNGGDFWRVTAGIEARSSRAPYGYAFVDLDLGYQHQTWAPNDPFEAEQHRGGLAIARVGYDGGGERIRVRATFELYKYHREFVDQMTTWDTGGGFTVMAGYRF
jgi:hypothetical protein